MTQPRVLVVSRNEELKNKALILARKIKLPFAGSLDYLEKNPKDFLNKFLLIVSEDLIYLKRGLTEHSKPIFCDFLKWSKQTNKSNLVKTMRGIPKKSLIVDATAGLGKDALVLSSLVDRLIVIEEVPWICALLEDGLNRSRDLIPNLSKVQVACSESNEYLLNLKLKPEAIYIDPMFEGTGKSKAKKEVQFLRELTNQTNGEQLLEVALKKAKNRVVVKRHIKHKYLAGLKPTFSLKGRIIRYDVYSIKLS